MESDDHSEWSGSPVELESLKGTRNSLWNEAQSMRIFAYEEAPPLFPELVFACFFLQKGGLEAREE